MQVHVLKSKNVMPRDPTMGAAMYPEGLLRTESQVAEYPSLRPEYRALA
jgi:hypothetical protein